MKNEPKKRFSMPPLSSPQKEPGGTAILGLANETVCVLRKGSQTHYPIEMVDLCQDESEN